MIRAAVFWPWCAGVVYLAFGIIFAFRNDIPRARGIDKVVCLGPALFAAPLAVFGAEHLTIPGAMANGVPHWIPGHLFWALFVGFALFAAALSIIVNRLSGLAATLLGLMLFSFVLLIHIPLLAAHPRDRFILAVVLRDLAFSAGAFALASTRYAPRRHRIGRRLATLARYVVGVAVVFFGVQHFLHPQFVPVVPLALPMPPWIPLHPLWAWSVGAALLLAGLAMLANWHARLATTWLGIVVCVTVLLVYLPILAVHPSDIGVSMNYFADTLAVAGNLLNLAASMPEKEMGREVSAQADASARLSVAATR